MRAGNAGRAHAGHPRLEPGDRERWYALRVDDRELDERPQLGFFCRGCYSGEFGLPDT